MSSNDLNDVKIYEALQKGIADTDNTSFKLLGLVPLLSGTALLTILLGKGAVQAEHLGIILIVSLFAATVTLGLFWWELRNSQICLWFIQLARELEQKTLPKLNFSRPNSPGRVGKRGATKIIYGTTICSWLVLPMTIPGFWNGRFWWLYIAVGLAIAVCTLLAVLASADPGPVKNNDAVSADS